MLLEGVERKLAKFGMVSADTGARLAHFLAFDQLNSRELAFKILRGSRYVRIAKVPLSSAHCRRLVEDRPHGGGTTTNLL